MVGLGEHGDDHGHSEQAKAQREEHVEDHGQQGQCGLATLRGLGRGQVGQRGVREG